MMFHVFPTKKHAVKQLIVTNVHAQRFEAQALCFAQLHGELIAKQAHELAKSSSEAAAAHFNFAKIYQARHAMNIKGQNHV